MDYENLTPQYRIEEYLEAIVEGWAEATQYPYPDYPSWRIEEFLDAFITYIWEDGGHPRHPCPNPVWRLEECLRAIYDVMTGAATPWPFPLPTTNRIEEYLAAIHAYLADGTELPVPEPVWRIEQWLAYVLDAVKQGGGVETTVSGTLVHITNALAKAALSVLASIEPIQDLHGYSSPWPAGGGKNLFDFDQTVGTTTIETSSILLQPGTYYVYVAAKSPNFNSYVQISSDGTSFSNIGTDSSVLTAYADKTMGYNQRKCILTVVSATYCRQRLQINSNVQNDRIAVMYTTDSTGYSSVPVNMTYNSPEWQAVYRPYSNICPISGRTGLSVYRTGKNLLNPATMAPGYIENSGNVHAQGNQKEYYSTEYYEVGSQTSISVGYNAFASTESKWIAINWYDANKTNLSRENKNESISTFTPASGAVYFRVSMRTYDHGVENCYCAFGSDTAYEPYNGNTYAFDWTSDAGTVYGGTLDVVTGVLTVDRAEVDLDGTEDWKVASTVYYLDISNNYKKGTGLSTVMSSALNPVPQQANTTAMSGADDNTITLYGGASPYYRIFVNHRSSATVEEFKEWLTSNNNQLVYELATPLTYQLTPQEVEMLLGENNVWSSSGDTVSVTYYAEGNANPLQSLNILLGGRYSNPKTADDVSDKEALEIILGGNK